MADSREINITISGNKKKTFRNFLSYKKIDKLSVDSKVKLYSDIGFEVTTLNEYDNPFGFLSKAVGRMSKIGDAVGAVTKIMSGVTTFTTGVTSANPWLPWIDNVNTFKKSEPFVVSVTVKFHMGEFGLWSGEEEVYRPIMNLMSIFLPRGVQGINILPHLRVSSAFLWDYIVNSAKSLVNFVSALTDAPDPPEIDALTFASPSIDAVKADAEADSTAGAVITKGVSAVDGAVASAFAGLSTGLGRVLVTTIGKEENHYVDISYASDKFIFRKMQPLNCSIKFSNKEYDDRGFPAYGEIKMDFKSFQPATLMGIQGGNIDFGFVAS